MILVLLSLSQSPFAWTQDDVPAFSTDPAEVLPDADQLVFAQSLEQAVQQNDIAAFNDLIDWEHIVDVATEGGNVPAATRAGFKTGVVETIQKKDSTGFAGTMIKQVQQGGRFKFLHLSHVDHVPIAVFRVNVPEPGGANYHQYLLKRSPDGKVRATDIYVFLSAERMSQTLSRSWLGLVQESSKTLLQKLTTPIDPRVAAMKPIIEMRKLIAEKDGEKALAIYRNLSEKVRQDKLMLIVRLHAAQLVSLAEYQATIDDYQKFHPNDPALDFLLIDGYALQMQHEKSLECINRVNEEIGGDAYLVSIRGLTLLALERNDEARQAVRMAIRMEPDFPTMYWNAIYVALKSDHFDEVPELLDTVQEVAGLRIGDLKDAPLYAEFVKSAEYDRWMESRKSR